jgi:hypothetical protein
MPLMQLLFYPANHLVTVGVNGALGVEKFSLFADRVAS